MNSIINIAVKSTHHNKPIVTDVFYNKDKNEKPIVIFCHGYKGYKDWGAWNLTVPEFVNNKLFFVKFNFSHNGGTLENPIDFPDLNAFGENNYTTELNDLEDIINWVSNNVDFENEVDINNITLIGHSRGGGIVSIKASENSKIFKLITWCSVSNFKARFPKGEMLKMWEKTGISFTENSRTKQKMPLLYQFYSNFKENEERLTIKNSVLKLKIPHLIVHGENDEVVLPTEAINLHKWNPKSELVLVPEMNHTLGCSHPWNDTFMSAHLKKVVQKSIDFILER